MEPIAYLTAEVKHRDLDSRLLIASHLLQAGIQVVVGQQWAIFTNAGALPPGIALFKTVNEIQAANMRNFKQQGHLVAATDEEVLICTEEHCFTNVFTANAAAHCDLFLAQSTMHRDAVERRFPALSGKVEVVGNPRVDQMAPRGRASFQTEADAIRAQHGPYVLFNTNYAVNNSIWPSLEAVIEINARAGAFNPNDPESRRSFMSRVDWERRNFEEMVQLLHWAADNLTNHKVVVRPHPVERPDFWQKELGGHANVLVVPRSTPHPWILGADLLVHTGCTTGLEAALMDRPAVNIMPSRNPIADMILDRVNPTFTSWTEAAPAIQDFLTSGRGPIAENAALCQQVLSQYFPGHDEGAAARLIAEKMVALLRAHGADVSKDHALRFRGKGFAKLQRNQTLKDKFTVGIQEIVDAFGRLKWGGGYVGNIRVQKMDDSLFLLTAA